MNLMVETVYFENLSNIKRYINLMFTKTEQLCANTNKDQASRATGALDKLINE